MESPIMTASTSCPLSSLGQRKSAVVRAPWCNADNCYRALFPCPSPWVVTEAVLYCATVSDSSASNYPTQAIAACGTGKSRYLSACSCPATNCPVGTTSQATTSHITTPPASVAKTRVVENDTSKSAPVAIVTQNQAPAPTIVTAASGGEALTQTTYDVVGGSDLKSSVGLANEPTTTDAPATADTLLNHVSSADGQTVYQGKSATKSQSPPSPHSPSSPPLTAPPGQSSKQASSSSSGLFPLLSKSASETQSTASSRTSPPTTVSLLVSARPSTPNEGSEGLGVGLVAAAAVGGTLVALLLLGAAAYYCVKRRKARRTARLRALTLSRESMPSQGFEVPPEWKPPVELPHQNAAVSRLELEDSFVSRAQPGDSVSQSAPVTPSSLSAHSTLALRDVAEMQGVSRHPSPAELFAMPAELPGVPKI